jgi:hypothetical protein
MPRTHQRLVNLVFDHGLPRVVTSMREGKGWTPCTFTFHRLDRVVLARWLHLKVILDPLDKHSTFLRSPFHHSLLCLF